jgi:hypothetical protein
MFNEIQDFVFECEDFVKIFNHFNNLNIIMYTNVETSSGTKKCEFCEQTVTLEWIRAYIILMCCTEDGVDERRNASGVKKW